MDTATPRRRRTTRVRRTEKAECGLTDAEKRRLTAYAERRGLSEASVLRELVLGVLDREGVQDPGQPTDLAA
jgi:hypothetical protein